MPRKPFKPGDVLRLVRAPDVRAIFKGWGHGLVIATWVEPVPGRPRDVIAKQKEFELAA